MTGSRPLVLTWNDVADTNILSTASFQYDPHSTPLKSSQQLNVDWSQFPNHCFFMSAEAKVNLAFDSIINGFPFDGTRQETEIFFDNLTGFDKWVFDNFPTFQGELLFSGTQVGETLPTAGTYIVVQNKVGALFPELASVASGQPVLNPTGSTSLTIEAQLFLPTIANDTQIVCQMMSGSLMGFSFHLLPNSSLEGVTGSFVVVSGSSYMEVLIEMQKGKFNHIALELNRDNGMPYLESFWGSEATFVSPTQVEMGDLSIDGASFVIGSGSSVAYGGTIVTPTQTLSGVIDEFRLFHSARTEAQQEAYAQKALYATDDLVLYLRFNEPTGSLDGTSNETGINAIVLDSSGNSLHTLVSNFTGSLKLNAFLDALNPVIYERPESLPILFPAYPPVIAFNIDLLSSASAYDLENPNLITKLIPQHYLLEGAVKDGFNDPVEGNEGQPFSGTGIPGQGLMGNVQILVSLLYIWARFFDEMKLFVDSFSTLRTVRYDTNETVPDNFLINLVQNMGFHLPPMFNDANIEQYVRGENVDIDDISTNEQTLRSVQNQLLRRVLVNLPDVMRSKGTQHSIRSFLRAVGIDPDNNLRIREFGGPTTQDLAFSRETKLEPNAMAQFASGSLVISPFLSASRTEPGFPGITGGNSDGLLTSGSWSWEGIIKYTPIVLSTLSSATQSLARLCVTGSVQGSGAGSAGIVANLLAISSSIQPKLVLYARPGDQASSPLLRMEIDAPVPGMFGFDRWNVSFGCQRGDDGLGSSVSSSYFLRLAYQNDGKIEYVQTTSSFFQEAPTGHNVFQHLNTASNASGSFFAVGSQQIINVGVGSQFLHLNDTSQAPTEARITNFDGRLSNVRFWSKALSVDEWQEHVRNYNSVGVENPLTNWNYATTPSGSFGRLRLNAVTMQAVRQADAKGALTFIDFSENGLHLTGSGFPIGQDILVGEIFDYSYLSPWFDEASSNQKVRARSFLDANLIEATPGSQVAPLYELDASETPTDDVRFIIEFSLIDALNRDIIAIFSSFDALDNALGSPELIFAPDYPDLQRLRDVYFNRIKDKLNFQAFFEFFRWFDTSIGTFIQQLVPRKTKFKGTNFTIESHMLERAKIDYSAQAEIYLGDSNRTNLDAVILLQQIAGSVRKF